MNNKIKKILLFLVAILAVGSIFFMFTISPPVNNKVEEVTEIKNREMPNANNVTDELTKGLVVKQSFINTTDNINEIAVVFSRIYMLEEKDSDHTLAIELLDGNKVLASTVVKSNEIPDQHRVFVIPDTPVSGKVGKELTLKIYENSKCDTGVALMLNDEADSSFMFGNKKYKGTICFSVMGQ